ncbi:hypothetical protein P879_10603 [Paragonimus westermani]|uniref:F-box and leucine-rich repeat protein 2/20 n=1 Tax=Paragonimus westermani TaxID=34504 RepID=A0A8T0DH77_9TREM|nr:hypothetical protein P879_10603 [Paragonimus westermani]
MGIRNFLSQFTFVFLQVLDTLLHHLVSLPYLTVLNLSGCTKLTDVAVKQMADSSYAAFLRELYLAGCDKLTDRSVLAMCGKLPQLAYLSLAFCSLLTDSAIESLAQCKQLRQVNLSNTKFGDQVVRQRLFGCYRF